MRSSTSQMDAAIIQPVFRSLTLARFNFDSGTLALTSGYSNIDYGGVTYLAGGALVNVSAAAEAPGMSAGSMSVTVSGVKSEMVALLLSEPYLNREAKVFLAAVDEDMVFDSLRCKQIFWGRMDAISGKTGANASFSISIKSRLADWERSRNLIYSDADQQKQYPGDRFCEYIPQISKMKILWPKAAALPDPRD